MGKVTGAPLLSLEHVHLRRGHRPVLDDVSVEVRAGELLTIIGPNGAGKSSLLHVMTRDLAPDAGHVQLAGRSIAAWSPRELARRRAVLPQSTIIEFAFSAQEIIAMGRAPWAGDSDHDTDHRMVQAAMQDTATATLASRDVTSLSGGEAARVHLARILSQDTPLLFLDEPTAALDLRHQEHVMAMARALADAGRGVVAVVHDLNLAGAWADRIVMLSDGRKVADGDATSVLRDERIADVYGLPVQVLDSPDGPVVVPTGRGRAVRPGVIEVGRLAARTVPELAAAVAAEAEQEHLWR